MSHDARSSPAQLASGVDRRDFLKTSAGAAAALVAGLSRAAGAGQDDELPVSRAWSQSKRAPASLISLPKGGGAVGGVGETVVPNLQTGTEGISIPLPLSSGRGGVGPQLRLDYSVAHGNGAFGIGWTLGLPEIARKTQGRLPRYDNDDTFLLDGLDLRPYGGALPERRGAYDVLAYRLRHESAFSRIEHWSWRRPADRPPAATPSFWCVTSKDNVTQIFGATADAVVADPAGADRIFRWALQLVYDGQGNIVHYAHKPEDGAGAPPEERGRPVAQTYLKRVRYGNLQPVAFADGASAANILSNGGVAALECFFEGVLDYGEHGGMESGDAIVTDDMHVELRPWDSRRDAFSCCRPGFEVRTRRTCRRFLMFHRIPESREPVLIGSLDFVLSSPLSEARRRLQTVTLLEEVVRRGYAPSADGGWKHSEDYLAGRGRGVRSRSHHIESIPPLVFCYSEFAPATSSTTRVEVRAEGLPSDGFRDRNVALVDLYQRGLPDILWTAQNAYFHWKNSGTGAFVREPRGVAPPRGAPDFQDVVLASGAVGFSELTSDDFPDLLVDAPGADRGTAGYCVGEPGSADGGLPRWRDYTPFGATLPFRPTDSNVRFVDLTGDGRLDALRFDGRSVEWFEGLGAAGFSGPRQTIAPDRLPALNDPRVHLADMTGDGLADLVLVDRSGVHYWPNLGRGRFGQRVTMKGRPLETFQPDRLHFIDVDGSGPADLVYVDSTQVQYWLNVSGSEWTEPIVVHDTPSLANGSPQLLDLQGTGIGGLLWPGRAGSSQGSYLALTVTKPLLLESVDNGMGRRTKYCHAPSTRFAIEADASGRPWKDRLPFPVYVLSRVVRYDDIAGSTLVSTFSYAHGRYDSREKEFRGFGRVEQTDAEYFSTAASPQAADLHVPPVRTTSWFHTGGLADGTVSRRHQDEYYAGDPRAPRLESTLPPGVSGERAREAARALAGRLVRTEVRALGDAPGAPAPPHPYSVTEYSYRVRLLPGGDAADTMSCDARQDQRVELRYELQPEDPQVAHEFALKADDYGHVLESVTVAYGRRGGGSPGQRRTLATYTVREYAARTSDPRGFRHGVLADERTYELHNLLVSEAAPLTRSRLLTWVEAATRLEFDAEPRRLGPQARLIGHSRHFFWRDDGLGVMPAGETGLLALPHHTRRKALTRGLIEKVYGSRVDGRLAMEAGYEVDERGDWWAPDGDPTRGTVVFATDRFCLPVEWHDELGRRSSARYDAYGLVPVETTDALQNVMRGTVDYRTLLLRAIQDVNGNVTTAAYDALGRLAGTAVAGRTGERVGDTLAGFRADLDRRTVHAFLDDPIQVGPAILAGATTRAVYDLWGHWRARARGAPVAPPVTCTLARETHAADLPAGETPLIQHTFLYADGFGREVQTKARAAGEPGLDARAAGVRWIGSGATLYDNKGNTIKKYEPFFSPTSRFESDAALTRFGVTPVFRHDPLGRLVRTDKPDGTLSLVKILPWQQEEWDEGDTVLESAWYRRRSRSLRAAERRAADLSRRFAGTRRVVQFDGLRRPVLRIDDNGPAGAYSTRIALDVQGNARSVTDARGNLCQQSDFDMLGRVLRVRSIDSGDRLRLPNVTGHPIREWDGAGRVVERRYDELHRPTDVLVAGAAGAARLVQRHVYGEGVAGAAAARLRGEVYQVHTDAAVVTNEAFDFKRNVTRWTQTSGTGPQAAAFSRVARYDALNRPVSVVHRDGSEVVTSYDERGSVRAIDVRPARGARFERHVGGVEYNARGQRTRLVYAGGVSVGYVYDRETFRLTRLTATRGDGSRLQDLSYTYDAAGNVVEVTDAAQEAVCHANERIEPRWLFEYDAVYRLTSARGREHRSVALDLPEDRGAVPVEASLPHRNDCRALANYHEEYHYDEVGNLRRMEHRTSAGGWVREYEYARDSNRLVASGPAGRARTYVHDDNGNLTNPSPSGLAEWDYADRLRAYREGEVRADYGYDASGVRVTKVVERGPTTDARAYAGDAERFERRTALGVELVRNTLHVTLGTVLVSRVESVTMADGRALASPASRTRFLLHDHLDSVRFEIDGAGAVVSYEECHPFGTAAYRAGPDAAEVSAKRFRYLGKELDEESGLYYFGARYYAPWLGRWTSCDPLGLGDGPNPYVYVGNNPLAYVDRKGLAREKKEHALPEIPKQGSIGHVAPSGGQGRAERSSTGVRTTENEHVLAKKQLEAVTLNPETGKSDYTDRHYRADDTLRWERTSARVKTHETVTSRTGVTTKGDNALSAELDETVGRGGSVSYSELRADRIEHTKTVRDLTGSAAPDASIHHAALSQDGGMFDIHRGADAGAAVREAGGVINDIRIEEWSPKALRAADHLSTAARRGLAALPVVGAILGQASAAQAAASGDVQGAALDELGNIPIAGDLLDAGRAGYALGESINELIPQPVQDAIGGTIAETLENGWKNVSDFYFRW